MLHVAREGHPNAVVQRAIAILTSMRAQIRDPHVRKLADGLIAEQEREIAEMDLHIAEQGWR